jgi:hypothetical protein
MHMRVTSAVILWLRTVYDTKTRQEKCKFVPMHVIKHGMRVEVKLQAFLTSAIDGAICQLQAPAGLPLELID